MDATSSYQAATKIDQTPLQSAQEIYAQAVSSGVELQSAAGLDTNFDSADNVTTGAVFNTQVYSKNYPIEQHRFVVIKEPSVTI